jgi:predicted DNA-binding transcriptional regulator AlpA
MMEMIHHTGVSKGPTKAQLRTVLEAVNMNLLTKNEVASLLKTSPRGVDRLAKLGRIPRPLRLGPKSVRWRSDELAKCLEQSGV